MTPPEDPREEGAARQGHRHEEGPGEGRGEGVGGQDRRRGAPVQGAVQAPPHRFPHHAAKASTPEPTAPPVAATEPVERITLAKAESKVLAEWEAAGRPGDRPSTPNLDAVQADHEAGGRKKAKVERTPRILNPRRAEANARQKELGKRGPGKRLSEAELREYVATVHAEHPDSPRNDELEYAYWIEGIAVSRGTWVQVWAEVVDGVVPVPAEAEVSA